MKKSMMYVMVLVLLVSVGSGCKTLLTGEVHDEILAYELPFDRAFVTVINAVDVAPGWSLESTNMPDGLVMARQPGSSGERAIVIVKRMEKNVTSVELSRNSQRILGVDKLLKAIDNALLAKA